MGLIGLGRHGSRYLRHLVEEDTGGKLVAISRQQVDKGRQQALHHRIQFFPDYRDLVADPAIQAKLTKPGWLTTSVEEIPWVDHWCQTHHRPYHIEEPTYPTALVGDPICFIRIE